MPDSLANAEIIGGVAVELRWDDAKLKSDLPKIKQDAEAAARSINVRLPVIVESQQVRAQLESAIRAATMGVVVRIPVIFDTSGSGGGVPRLLTGAAGGGGGGTFNFGGASASPDDNGLTLYSAPGTWTRRIGVGTTNTFGAPPPGGGGTGGSGGGLRGNAGSGGGGGSNFFGRGFGRMVSAFYLARTTLRDVESIRQYNIDSSLAGGDSMAQWEAIQTRINSSPFGGLARLIADPIGNDEIVSGSRIAEAKSQAQRMEISKANTEAIRDSGNAATLSGIRDPYLKQLETLRQNHEKDVIADQERIRITTQNSAALIGFRKTGLDASREEDARKLYEQRLAAERAKAAAGVYVNPNAGPTYEGALADIDARNAATLQSMRGESTDRANRLGVIAANHLTSYNNEVRELNRNRDFTSDQAMLSLGSDTRAALLRPYFPRAAARDKLLSDNRTRLAGMMHEERPFRELGMEFLRGGAEVIASNAENVREDRLRGMALDTENDVDRLNIARDPLGARLRAIRGARDTALAQPNADAARINRNADTDAILARQNYYEGVQERREGAIGAGLSASYRGRQMPLQAAMASFIPKEQAALRITDPGERASALYAIQQEKGAAKADYDRMIETDQISIDARQGTASLMMDRSSSRDVRAQRAAILQKSASLRQEILNAPIDLKEALRKTAHMELAAMEDQLTGWESGGTSRETDASLRIVGDPLNLSKAKNRQQLIAKDIAKAQAEIDGVGKGGKSGAGADYLGKKGVLDQILTACQHFASGVF